MFVKREIQKVYSKGTFAPLDYEPSYCMAIYFEMDWIGCCYFDLSTRQCYMGQFQDDPLYSSLRTLLSQVRPVEIIIERDQLPPDLLKLVKN